MSWTVQDLIEQVTVLTASGRPAVEIVADFNRGLLSLASSLLLVGRADITWQAGVDTKPAPADLFQVRRHALWTGAGGSRLKLRRINPDDYASVGFWCDGSTLGIRWSDGSDGPLEDGTLTVYYFRYPRLLSVEALGESPEGGDRVGQMLVDYACMKYYQSLGDEESFRIAREFERAFMAAKQELLLERRQLLSAPPGGVVF